MTQFDQTYSEDATISQQITTWLQMFNDKYSVVLHGGQTYVVGDVVGDGTITFMTFKAFEEYFRNATITEKAFDRGGRPKEIKHNIAKLWLSDIDRRTYRGVEFRPLPYGQVTNNPIMLNLWTGFAVKPQRGDCSLYWKMVRDVIADGDKEIYQYIRKWMAHAVQKPHLLPGTAIVLRGSKGTGKGTFANAFGKLFGKGYMPTSNLDHLTGTFSGHLLNKVVIFADEAVWGGQKQSEGQLKTLITEPLRTIEMKYKDAFVGNNYNRVIIASNEDWAAPVGLGERRYLVCNVSNKYRQNTDYFGAIRDQLDNGGMAALMHDLVTEDIAHFNPHTLPDKSFENAADMIALSVSREIESIIEWLNTATTEKLKVVRGSVGTYKAYTRDIYQIYNLICDQSHAQHRYTPAKFGAVIRKHLPVLTDSKDANGAYVTIPSIEQCRKHFESVNGRGVRWDHPSIDNVVELDRFVTGS